jgi:hypothetical protein
MKSLHNVKYFGWKSLIGLVLVCGLCSCNDQTPAGNEIGKPMQVGTSRGLALLGYNYTDRNINAFSVNGQSGGNLGLSGPGGGGGGSVCCVNYVAGKKINTVRIRWQVAACMVEEGATEDGQMSRHVHNFYKEVEVNVDPAVPADPHNFEVHFYPDGHIEAAITREKSFPRVKLDENRLNESEYPRCPNGKEPKD